jgi:hypothetical protein
VLPPEEVLEQVHHYKTGLLFQSVWAVPEALGDGDPALITDLKHALYRIGLGCQVLDDLVDLQADVRNHRHNYVASLIRHASDLKDWEHLVRRCGDADIQEGKEACLDAFPEARRTAVRTARELLGTGLTALLDPRHRAFVNPALQFIAERIGAAAIMEAVPLENG